MLVGAVQGAVGTIGTVVATLVLPFYLLIEAASLQSGFLKLFAPERRPRIARMTRDVTVKVGAWLNSQCLLSVVIGVTASLGLWVLGVPYFYVLGLIAAVGEFVPIIGPILAAMPSVLLGFSVSVHTGIFVIVVLQCAAVHRGQHSRARGSCSDRSASVPGRSSSRCSSAASCSGVVGAILAVPSAAIVQVFLQEYLEREEEHLELNQSPILICMRPDPLAFLSAELEAIRQQGLYRSPAGFSTIASRRPPTSTGGPSSICLRTTIWD